MRLCRGLRRDPVGLYYICIYIYIYMLNVDLGLPVVCPVILVKDPLFGPRSRRIVYGVCGFARKAK